MIKLRILRWGYDSGFLMWTPNKITCSKRDLEGDKTGRKSKATTEAETRVVESEVKLEEARNEYPELLGQVWPLPQLDFDSVKLILDSKTVRE